MPNSPSAKVCDDLKIYGVVRKRDWSFREELKTKPAKKAKESLREAQKSKRQALLDSL